MTVCYYGGDLNDLFRIDEDFVGPFIRLIPPNNLDELRHFKILLVRSRSSTDQWRRLSSPDAVMNFCQGAASTAKLKDL
jgi:hypothetical protein